MTQIWADLLNLPRVGISDNFFELGGHSLLATQLVSKLRQQFDVELAVRQVFENPTVADLVRTLEGEDGVALPPIVAVPPNSLPRAELQPTPEQNEAYTTAPVTHAQLV